MKLVRFSLQWRIQVFPGAPTPGGSANLLLPPANVVWGKVMFLHMSVILSTGGSLYDVTSSLAAGGVLCPRRVSVRGWVCVQGVCVQEGLCQEHPTLYDKEQSVRILLKCILVWYNFCRKCIKINKLDWVERCASLVSDRSVCLNGCMRVYMYMCMYIRMYVNPSILFALIDLMWCKNCQSCRLRVVD